MLSITFALEMTGNYSPTGILFVAKLDSNFGFSVKMDTTMNRPVLQA